jgi:hypothetical protein
MRRIRVVLVDLGLVPRDANLVRVEDDHEVAGVDVGGIRRLVLALDDVGDAGRESAEHLVGGVDHVPVGLYFARLGHIGAHVSSF